MIFIIGLIAVAMPLNATTIIPPDTKIILPGNTINKIVSLKIGDVQKMIGRKLTLKEKISFLILRHQLKHKADSKNVQSKLALIFGILAAALLVGGLFIPALFVGSLVGSIVAIVLGTIARKENSSDKKALAAILLGWITLGLLTLLVLVIIIILANWSWY